MSVSEHAVFACEFAGGGGNKRRNEDRKLSVSVLDVFLLPHLHDGTGVPRVQYSYETFCARADINENYCAYLRNI